MGLLRLTGWTIYVDDNDTMTFRHKCGWEVYADPDTSTSEVLSEVRDHVC